MNPPEWREPSPGTLRKLAVLTDELVTEIETYLASLTRQPGDIQDD